MALVRCENCGAPRARTRTYIRRVNPQGHPRSGLVCGRTGCEGAGLIWLEPHEVRDYGRGQRVFSLATGTTKVRAQ